MMACFLLSLQTGQTGCFPAKCWLLPVGSFLLAQRSQGTPVVMHDWKKALMWEKQKDCKEEGVEPKQKRTIKNNNGELSCACMYEQCFAQHAMSGTACRKQPQNLEALTAGKGQEHVKGY